MVYLLIPWNRVLLEKLIGSQIVVKFSTFYGTREVHHRIHSWRPTFPILRHIDLVHSPIFHFLKIHLNIIHPSTPGSYKWPLSLMFPHQNPVDTSTVPISEACPSHFILLHFIIRTLYCFLLSPITSSLLGLNILHSTPLSNTLSLRSSLNVSDQVSHPSKTRGKIMCLYILIFKF